MPFELGWYLEPLVLHVTFSGDVQIEELLDSIHRSKKLTEHSSDEVYVLINFSGATSTPMNFRKMRSLMATEQNPKVKMRLIYGTNKVVNIVAGSFGRLMGLEMHFFETLPDAVTWLRGYDPAVAALLEHKEIRNGQGRVD